MDTLAELHLALREAGWEPEHVPAHYPEDNWYWSLAGCPIMIWTSKDEGRVEWCECKKVGPPPFAEYRQVGRTHVTVEELRDRLKELARVG